MTSENRYCCRSKISEAKFRQIVKLFTIDLTATQIAQVIGLIKRQGQVYTEIGKDCSKAILQQIIRGRVAIESVVHSDGWRGHDGLVEN